MTTRDLRTLLGEAEREIVQTALPGEVDRRLRARLISRPASKPLRTLLLAGAGLCAVGVALALGLTPRATQVPAEVRVDAYVLIAPSADLKFSVGPDRVIEISSGQGSLVSAEDGERLTVIAPAKLRRDATGVRVLSGKVEFAVKKRSSGQPLARVQVSHGTIEVLGTRFTVSQQDAQGSVTLHEGEIRFTDLSGNSRALAPGDELGWPLAAVAPAPVEVPEPPRVEPAPKSKAAALAPIRFRDPEDLLQQVDVLRSRREFPEAVRYLTHGLTTPLRPATRERFSYELGSILTYQLSDARRACRHWAEHLRRYPDGRYRTEVAQAAEHAGCPGTQP